MPGITYNTPAARIGKVKGEILGHAEPYEVLRIGADNKSMPKKSSNTIVFRRWLPYGGATTNATTINQWVVSASAHVLQEGVTPSADSITPQDITVVMQQYGCLYMYTDVQEDLGEDDMAPELKQQVGQRMGLVREMVRYGQAKACTNVFYAGGTSRSTVDEAISKNLLRRVARSLQANTGKPVTRVLAASAMFNTSPVAPAYLVFTHTDMAHNIRELPNFVPVESYGSRKPIHDMEIGAVDNYRFILSPFLSAVADSGAAVGTTGLYSTSGSNVDVYPTIVMAQDAFADLALRGSSGFDYTNLKPGQKDKSDVMGQRGYVGAKFYAASFVQNDGWMAVVECGIADLS